jgi:hypothetical protein
MFLPAIMALDTAIDKGRRKICRLSQAMGGSFQRLRLIIVADQTIIGLRHNFLAVRGPAEHKRN